MNKKRIAICFHGQTRLFELIDHIYSKWNDKSEEYIFDFYASTWDEFDDKSSFDYFVKSEFLNPKNPNQTKKPKKTHLYKKYKN